MKNLKTILSVFALAAVFSANAFAQVSENVAVTATVQASIDLTASDIALGAIMQAASTIQANSNDAASNDNLGTGASAGSLQIDGTSGVTVDVTWANATLTNGTPAEDAIFTPSVYNGSTALSSGDDVTLTGGSVTLDVGGSLAAPGGTGSYTTVGGTPIVFTVQYN